MRLAGVAALAGLSALWIAAAPVQAGNARQVQEFGDKQLVFSLPPGFKFGYGHKEESFLIREYVPSGQNVYNWTQMVTLTVEERPRLTAKRKAESVAERYKRNCPDSFNERRIRYIPPEGFVYRVIVLGCGAHEFAGRSNAIGETVVMLLSESKREVLTLQFAQRFAPKDHPPELDPEEFTDYLRAMRPRLTLITE